MATYTRKQGKACRKERSLWERKSTIGKQLCNLALFCRLRSEGRMIGKFGIPILGRIPEIYLFIYVFIIIEIAK